MYNNGKLLTSFLSVQATKELKNQTMNLNSVLDQGRQIRLSLSRESQGVNEIIGNRKVERAKKKGRLRVNKTLSRVKPFVHIFTCSGSDRKWDDFIIVVTLSLVG